MHSEEGVKDKDHAAEHHRAYQARHETHQERLFIRELAPHEFAFKHCEGDALCDERDEVYY